MVHHLYSCVPDSSCCTAFFKFSRVEIDLSFKIFVLEIRRVTEKIWYNRSCELVRGELLRKQSLLAAAGGAYGISLLHFILLPSYIWNLKSDWETSSNGQVGFSRSLAGSRRCECFAPLTWVSYHLGQLLPCILQLHSRYASVIPPL